MEPLNLLFVCVENSCRSQMAEAFARGLGDDRVRAYSAGSEPSGIVDERAARFMAELGHGFDGHESKGLDTVPNLEYDAVVTMGCGDACAWVPAKRRIDWDLPDPKPLSDNEFRSVRDEIGRRVAELIDEVAV